MNDENIQNNVTNSMKDKEINKQKDVEEYEEEYEEYEEEIEVNEENMGIIQNNILNCVDNLKSKDNKTKPDVETFELLKNQMKFLELMLDITYKDFDNNIENPKEENINNNSPEISQKEQTGKVDEQNLPMPQNELNTLQNDDKHSNEGVKNIKDKNN